MTSHADFLDIYKQIREVRLRVNHLVVKKVSPETLDEGGRKLGLLEGKTLVLNSEEDLPILMDYCVYNCRSGGLNVVQQYLAESPPRPGSEESAVLDTMLEAYFSVFEVLDVEQGVGVTVRDLLRGDSHFLMDVGFGSTARKGLVFATRVIPMEGLLTTNGAALPFTPDVWLRVQKALGRMFAPGTDFRQLTPEQETDMASLLIRHGLSAGMSSRVAFLDPGQGLPEHRRTLGAPTRPREPERPLPVRERQEVQELLRTQGLTSPVKAQ